MIDRDTPPGTPVVYRHPNGDVTLTHTEGRPLESTDDPFRPRVRLRHMQGLYLLEELELQAPGGR
jgi:hypothetical protein